MWFVSDADAAPSFGTWSVCATMFSLGENDFKHVNVNLVGADASPGQVCWIAVLSVLPIPGRV